MRPTVDAPARIAKTKSPMLGCITSAEIRQSRNYGGYIILRTTGSADMIVIVPRPLFVKWASHVIGNKDGPFVRAEAERVCKWLRTRMVLFNCSVRVFYDEDSTDECYYWDCSAVDLMEGEYDRR